MNTHHDNIWQWKPKPVHKSTIFVICLSYACPTNTFFISLVVLSWVISFKLSKSLISLSQPNLEKISRARCWRGAASRDSETCQDCGRRYSWSHWVSASELYVLVKGNGGGTFCPRCFGKMAEAKGIRLLWTPILENRRTVHGDIMDGHLIFRPLALRRLPSSSAPKEP